MNLRTAIVKSTVWMLCGSLCATAGCVRGRHSAVLSETMSPAGHNEETARALLESDMNVLIRAANERHASGEREVREAAPYFFSVSEYFPEGPGQFRMSIHRVAGSRPRFEASVVVPCHRYMTRYHLSRSAAARDDEVIREEGVMRYAFMQSGSRWVQKYSYFEPAVVRVLNGSEWTETPFVADRFVEDKPSFWKRWLGFVF